SSSPSGRGLGCGHLPGSSHILFRRAAMFRYEIARIQPTVCLFAVTGANKWRDEFAHFKMEMREILTISRANGCDLLAAPHVIPCIDQYLVAMAIIRLHVAARAILLDCVQHDDDVAPARSSIAAVKNHAPVFQIDLRDNNAVRSEEHTSELQSPYDLVCRLLLVK